MNENTCPICNGNDLLEINKPENYSNNGINVVYIINYMRCKDCESTHFTFYQSRRNKIEYLYAVEKTKKT